MNPDLTAAELETDLIEVGAVAAFIAPNSEAGWAVGQKLGLMMIESVLNAGMCTWRIRERLVPTPHRCEQIHNGDATIFLHTSATTGKRKVVPISGENLSAMLENTANALELTKDDRLLLLARLFHTQGTLSPLAQLLTGGSVIVTQGFTPQGFRQWLEVLKPTWFTCGPTLHRTILNHFEEHPLQEPSSLRFIRSGGASLPPDLAADLERVLQTPVLDVYGLTETGAVACTTINIRDLKSIISRQGSVGKSMGPEIAVMAANGEFLQPGVEGEIVVSGPTVMSGYLNAPAANHEAFRGRWFRTGDLGWLNDDGFCTLQDD